MKRVNARALSSCWALGLYITSTTKVFYYRFQIIRYRNRSQVCVPVIEILISLIKYPNSDLLRDLTRVRIIGNMLFFLAHLASGSRRYRMVSICQPYSTNSLSKLKFVPFAIEAIGLNLQCHVHITCKFLCQDQMVSYILPPPKLSSFYFSPFIFRVEETDYFVQRESQNWNIG